MKTLELSQSLEAQRRNVEWFEDFLEDLDAAKITNTKDGTATTAVGDAANGLVTLTTAATDNNENYLLSVNESFLIAADAPLIAECRVLIAQGNTDDLNFAFGFMNAVGANALQDNGAGPKATYSGAVFYMVDGDTLLNVSYNDAGTAKTRRLEADLSLTNEDETGASASYQTLRIEIRPKTSAYCDVLFFRDGSLVAKFTDQAYANAEAMMVFVGIKAGGANDETLVVDYLLAAQRRA